MYADYTVPLLRKRLPETHEVSSAETLNMTIQYCHIDSIVVNGEETKQPRFVTDETKKKDLLQNCRFDDIDGNFTNTNPMALKRDHWT